MVLGLTSDIKIKVNSEKDCVKTLSVELASSVVQEKIEKAYESIRSQAKVPGFRPGKAPMEQIKESFKGLAYEKAQEILLQHGVTEALKAKKLNAIQTPVVLKMDFDPAKAFHFEFQVEVPPEFKPANYKGLKLSKSSAVVSESDVKKALDNIANMNARLIESKDETLTNTHYAVVDYEGFMADKPIEGAKAENFLMDMSAPQAIAGLSEGLLGAKAGEERKVSVKFPDDSPAKELAGKEAVFKVKLTAIKEKKMPSLDDEFAKDLGIETLEVLKTRVKENLERERQNSVKSEIEKQIIDKLLEENNFAVPPSLVKQQAERLMERQKERLGEQGYGKDDADKVLDRIKADIQKEAERQIRLAYILDAIADLEEVKVSDEEVAARIDLMISQSQPKERPSVEKILKGPYRDRIRSEMREEKLFTWLTEQAKIKEVSAAS